MKIGEVVGSVVSTRKDEKLANLKLLVVRVRSHVNEETDDYVVAVDAVQAGVGDLVLYATGSSARQTEATHEKPCDAIIMAIVDSWDIGGENVYEKWR